MIREFLLSRIMYLIPVALFIFMPGRACTSPPLPFFKADREFLWVDTILQSMNLEDKLGQLFIVESGSSDRIEFTKSIIEKYQPGGVILKDLPIGYYQEVIDVFRQLARIGLFELSDAHISLNNQIADLPDYPSNAGISAMSKDISDKLLYTDKLIEDYLKVGINATFSPNIQTLIDNPENYQPQQEGLDLDSLLIRAAERVNKFQQKKILSIASSLEILPDSLPEFLWRSHQCFESFKPLIESGLSGILLDDRHLLRDSCEKMETDYIKDYLSRNYNFGGLIFAKSDGLLSLERLLIGGADVLIIPSEQLPLCISQLKAMITVGDIREKDIDLRLRKILKAKKWLNLDRSYGVQNTYSAENKNSIVRSEEAALSKLYQQSIVLANNPDSLLPIKESYSTQFQMVHVGARRLYEFQNSFFRYSNFSQQLYRPGKDGKINALAYNPSKEGTFVITLEDINLSGTRHKEFIRSINHLNKSSNLVVVNFGNPMNLGLLDSTVSAIQLFDCNPITEQLAAELIFGATQAHGRMPIPVSPWIREGAGQLTPIIRLQHVLPEALGLSSEKLSEIDSIMESAIRQQASPGGQVVIAKSGKIIYSKAFGFHTYEKRQQVELTDLYDVASITKVAATTLAAMHLYEAGELDLDKRIIDHIPLPEEGAVKDILLRQLFIHKSGLQRNMPIAFYLRNQIIGKDSTNMYCHQQNEPYSLKISNGLFIDPTHLDSIWQKVCQLPKIYHKRKYLYSDVNFYLIHQIIEQLTKEKLDSYLNRHFYQPLGLRHCTFNPLDRFPADVAVPTQDDQFWRKTLLRGSVHDEAAAILGGVGGNAGLFASAEDLVIVFQMLLNGGRYGGKQFLNEHTIDYFTAATHGNHRGLGFDKVGYNYTVSRSASANTYGHSGFSGTCVWVDPDEELVYVFLSNRIHPNPKNNLLKKMKVRRRVHQVIYDAINAAGSKAVPVEMAGD